MAPDFQAEKAEIGRLLGDIPLVRQIYCFEEIGSTSDWARDLLARGGGAAGLAGTLVVADFQAAGRGRMRRSWVAPRGTSLLFSIVLPAADAARPGPAEPGGPAPSPWAEQGFVSVAAAVAVCEGVAEAAQTPAEIKYPNDVMVGGRKTAGILVERAEAGSGAFFIAGIGVNVSQERDQLPRQTHVPATSLLLETGRAVPRPALLRSVLARLQHYLAQPPGHAVAALNALCSTLGRFVAVQLEDRQVCGLVTGIGTCGELIVREDSGVQHAIYSGDVRMLDAREGDGGRG